MIDLEGFKVNAMGGGGGGGGPGAASGFSSAAADAASAAAASGQGQGVAGELGGMGDTSGVSAAGSSSIAAADAASTAGEAAVAGGATGVVGQDAQATADANVALTQGLGFLSAITTGLLGFDTSGLVGSLTGGMTVGSASSADSFSGSDPDGNQFGPGDYDNTKKISSAVVPTLNQIPSQAGEAIAKQDNEPTLNPEEAAAEAKDEERKKARQRVGLMQMRAVDPLFVEGLPDIFRPRAS